MWHSMRTTSAIVSKMDFEGAGGGFELEAALAPDPALAALLPRFELISANNAYVLTRAQFNFECNQDMCSRD